MPPGAHFLPLARAHGAPPQTPRGLCPSTPPGGILPLDPLNTSRPAWHARAGPTSQASPGGGAGARPLRGTLPATPARRPAPLMPDPGQRTGTWIPVTVLARCPSWMVPCLAHPDPPARPARPAAPQSPCMPARAAGRACSSYKQCLFITFDKRCTATHYTTQRAAPPDRARRHGPDTRTPHARARRGCAQRPQGKGNKRGWGSTGEVYFSGAPTYSWGLGSPIHAHPSIDDQAPKKTGPGQSRST